jgi:hypothetical protein
MRYAHGTTLASLCPTKCLTSGCDGAPATPGGACADDAACGQVRRQASSLCCANAYCVAHTQ